jgi:hypothetical protein
VAKRKAKGGYLIHVQLHVRVERWLVTTMPVDLGRVIARIRVVRVAVRALVRRLSPAMRKPVCLTVRRDAAVRAKPQATASGKAAAQRRAPTAPPAGGRCPRARPMGRGPRSCGRQAGAAGRALLTATRHATA